MTLARVLVSGLTLALSWAAATAAEPLVYERFENSTVGKIAGGVSFTNDVVGHGGLVVPNQAAAVFDGKPGTCVHHGPDVKITAPDFTVEAFVKVAGTADYQTIAAAWNEDENQRSWALVVSPGGGLRFDVSPDGGFHAGNVLATPTDVIEPGTWYHVAAVSQGSTSRLYVNGREVLSKRRAIPGIFAGKANLKIASADRYATEGPRPLCGCLDEVRITPAALAPDQFLKTRQPMPEVQLPGPPEKYAMPFVATSKDDAMVWQERARARLLELVAKQEPRYSLDEVPIDLKLDKPEDRGAYTLYKASFQANSKTPLRRLGLLAVPKGQGPFPAMLALHGHGGSAEAVFDPKILYHGMADRFARGGYVVFAPSLPHRPYAAMELWDLFRAVEVLRLRPEVDRQRIGVGGLSMGGEWTMWIAACDPRLKVAVVSGWMCTTEGVFSVPNCKCWRLPGLVELMDICEVHLLIAPRPVLFESAARDGCFPIRYTKEGFARIRAGYQVFGAAEAVAQDIWDAGHEWHGAMAYPFVDKVLGGNAAAAK
ncbi:MAG: acetylxylan esterase [Thermoguttaceae bacterium]|jgi:dienelactone hydrolase|nr:acetylxylan esterase [Thermoguttaceae bacterium]